ncbi:MAG: MFS transporter, partial [Muribaculaceae bacterium]|nr:MFS transporter [Muribaculaceae bacterium]
MKTSAPKPVDMAAMPMGWPQIRIVLVASLGQFVGQGLATLIGIVIPLMQLAARPELSAAAQGLLGCVSLIGIMVGTVVFGRLSDRYGYLLFFRLCPLVIAAASLAAAFTDSVTMLTACLFVMGAAIGGEYSLDPDYISELMPEKWRVYMVGVAKALASAGSAAVAAVCDLLISRGGAEGGGRYLFLVITAIAAVMLLTRIRFAQSPQWLMSRGQTARAEAAVRQLLGPGVVIAKHRAAGRAPAPNVSIATFIKKNAGKIILTGIPWACEGLGVYGIGIFLPVLIMSFRLDTLPPTATPLEHITGSVGLTFILSLVMMAGFAIGILT